MGHSTKWEWAGQAGVTQQNGQTAFLGASISSGNAVVIVVCLFICSTP